MYETLVHLFEGSCRKFGDRDLFGVKRDGQWAWTSYAEFEQLVANCCAGFAEAGVNEADRVAIIADNCTEWATVAFATYCRGASFVPLYTAQLPDEWEFILNDCGAKLVVVQTAQAYEAIQAARERMPSVQKVVGLHLPESDPDSYAALLRRGAEQPVPNVHPKPEDIAGYIYTSGTTGAPKGVKLTHANFCSNVGVLPEVFPLHREISLAFLPWAHAFGQTAELYFFFQQGFALALNDAIPNLVDNLSEVKPTILIAVPRIFNRIYEGVNRQMAAKPAPIRALFRRGLACAKRQKQGEVLSLGDRLVLALAERLIFSKVRAKFGGRLKLVISGSAALNKDIAEFVDALGIMLYEGYGLTETSPVVTVNYPGHRKIGSVGRSLPGVRVAIDESQSETPSEGEIIVYGPNVMVGYHNREEETRSVMTEDGGFRTGDLGYLDEDGYLYITGRSKELYKLETGRYVAPAALEEELKVSPYISNVVLYGANKPYNVALVVPDKDALQRWSGETGTPLGDTTKNPKVQQLIVAEIEKYGAGFKSFERPKRTLLIDEDFTTDNGLLTPKMSVKRNEVLKRYGAQLDELY